MKKKKRRKQVRKPKRSCIVHTGERGGKYEMHRKKGGGTKRVYISSKR